MCVVLFLPHTYDFFHSDAAKSSFAIPPSGVHLIDRYQHVHCYFQKNNPGPYVAYGYWPKEPTQEEDLKLPSPVSWRRPPFSFRRGEVIVRTEWGWFT